MGYSNLKTMINDSTVNSFLKERFFSILSPESLIPDFKQESPLCPQRPQCPLSPSKKLSLAFKISVIVHVQKKKSYALKGQSAIA
jgi:hypothetical protein